MRLTDALRIVSTTLLPCKISLENINQGEGTLSKLINEEKLYDDVLKFVDNANLLIVDAKDLIGDVKENPKKWLKAYFAAKREDARENK